MIENITTGAAATVQVISVTGPAPFKNPGDVDFDVKYPEDYKGAKYMPEGVVIISKESAEQFTKLGIGKVVGSDEAKAETTETSAQATDAKPLTAKELIEKINVAETAEAVDALLPEGENRTTVLTAADARKKQLSQ